MRIKIFSYSKNGLINLKVIPNSSKSEFVFDEKLKVKINAPPEDGKANAELIKLFKKAGLKIQIVKGLKSNDKIVKIIND